MRSRVAARLALTLACACTAAWSTPNSPDTATAGNLPSEPDASVYAPVLPGRTLEFPADYGSHPAFRTEWWYITGWLDTARGESLGFQITFFRTRPTAADTNPSRFAARQLVIAHCAISDPKRGRLWQDQRIRRAGLGLADTAAGDTHAYIGDWRLDRRADGTYRATLAADGFDMTLDFQPTQAVLANGEAGFSRKGPSPRSASYYYSIPHLAVQGTIGRSGDRTTAHGDAWFDHEWSSDYLDASARGWDWVGVNLNDGGALMAFRIRDAAGATFWSGGSLRDPDGHVRTLDAGSLAMTPQRRWRSPRTATDYPVEWQLRAGARTFELQPLMDDQENDTRLSTGAIYWEGAIRVRENGHPAGRGYLELTGYDAKLNLR